MISNLKKTLFSEIAKIKHKLVSIPAELHLHSFRKVAPVLALFSFFIFLIYGHTFYSLISWWIVELRYQMMVVGLCAAMVFMRRADVFASKKSPKMFLGTALLLFGIFLFIDGRLSANHLLQEFSFIFVLAGLVVQFHGLHLLRLLFLPLVYLLFSSHLFFLRPEAISYHLQLVSANISTALLKLLGMSVLINGTYIRLPATTLHVVDLCSGYNQVFTLLALMLPITYITNRAVWKQSLIIFLAFPVGLFMNSLRILGIAIYNYSTLHEQIHGPFEIFRMPFIF
jgi:exosortase